jgi:3-deoxy-manno-octulosonate cytidylyltransferase (CMP-KDO synthetase)
MNYIVVIPARMASSRLPGKPLIDLHGKSMIRRTYERCIEAVDKDLVYVATDHHEIMAHCNNSGMNCIMTSSECLTGTDRVAEVANYIEADYYINVQGDEPLMNPDDITKVIDSLHLYQGEIICGYAPILDEASFLSRSIPKVVFSENADLIYMSRSPIPGNKKSEFIKAWRQVCVYAFPRLALNQYASRINKTPLEEIEDLEILRFLEMGTKVKVVELSTESIAVDTEEDVERILNILK